MAFDAIPRAMHIFSRHVIANAIRHSRRSSRLPPLVPIRLLMPQLLQLQDSAGGIPFARRFGHAKDVPIIVHTPDLKRRQSVDFLSTIWGMTDEGLQFTFQSIGRNSFDTVPRKRDMADRMSDLGRIGGNNQIADESIEQVDQLKAARVLECPCFSRPKTLVIGDRLRLTKMSAGAENQPSLSA